MNRVLSLYGHFHLYVVNRLLIQVYTNLQCILTLFEKNIKINFECNKHDI